VLLFSVLWGTFSYFPIAHMVWDANGYLFAKGAIDFAGGTVVHINAGIAALVGCLMIGKRVGLRQGQHGAAFDGDDHDRRLDAVGRLVRLQRRLEP
jgi:ammonia channel protein AmtB